MTLITTRRITDATVVGLALGIAYALKSYYSRAGFDDLRWILAPTTRLVEHMTGSVFELEAQQAFLSRELLFEIVPSCAGVNFMIALFCSLACGLVHAQPTVLRKFGWLAASGVAAYLLTIVANATRIAIAIGLHILQPSLGLLTPERLHRIEGIVVYFCFLCVAYGVAAHWTGAQREPAAS